MWRKPSPWRWRAPTSWSRPSRPSAPGRPSDGPCDGLPPRPRLPARMGRLPREVRIDTPPTSSAFFLSALGMRARTNGQNPKRALSRRKRMRLIGRLGIVFAAALALSAPVAAQDYPNHPVKIIVPFGAGGPADVFARIVGQYLQEALKQSFVIENRPGAGAVIGTNEVAKSAPDGYTLLMMSNTHTVSETLLPARNYQLMRDFTAVAPINSSDLLMVAHPSVPAKDLKEFLALLKSKPGELNYASSGPGTPYHMAAELFKSMSGTNLVHVPHRGSGDARTSVIGGHVQMMIDAITTMAPTA